MSDLVAVVGAVTPPGRLNRSAADSLARAESRHPGLQTALVNLADRAVAFADGRPPDQFDDDTGRTVAEISEARAVLLCSPVYRGSISGSLKNLLDQLPIEALQGKPVGIVAVGATYHHYLGVDRHLRDILTWFGALVPPTSAYLVSADFTEGAPNEEALKDLDALTDAVVSLRGLPAASLGPVPLAARRQGP